MIIKVNESGYPNASKKTIDLGYSLIRNEELNNLLSLDSSITITAKDSSNLILTLDKLPNYSRFDESGWIAMLCDTDKTNTTDPTSSGDYLYKYDCSINKDAKTLTFSAGKDLSGWEENDHLVLYNPFLNYNFVGDQTEGPIFSITGAPNWRSYASNGGPLFKNSKGYYTWIINGQYTSGTPRRGQIGYATSPDMINWTMQRGDTSVFGPSSIPNCFYIVSGGGIGQLNDGTNRYYTPLNCSRTPDTSAGEIRILYFDENFTNFSFSGDVIVRESSAGHYGGSILKIDDYYHILYMTLPASGRIPDRTIMAGKSLNLEGPYIPYQAVVKGIGSNNGVAWSGNYVPTLQGGVDTPMIGKYKDTIFGLFGATSQWSGSGNKGNRVFCLLDFDKTTEKWSLSNKGPVVINPFYFNAIYGKYYWAQDHTGGYPSLFVENDDIYLSLSMNGESGGRYQAALVKLNNYFLTSH